VAAEGAGANQQRMDALAKSRARLRVVLGMAQIFMAVFSFVLLVKTGVNAISLASVIVTCLLTTISVLLFGSRYRRGKRNNPTDSDA
jgi:hypothetical protein